MSVYVTAREGEILALIKCGANTQEIAATIGVSKWTIRDQIRNLGVKFQVAGMAELPDAAAEHGIVVPDCYDENDDGEVRLDGGHGNL